MHQKIAICGLKNSGKTTLICHLLQQFKKNKNKEYIGLKPFEVGLLQRNALDDQSDAEVINQYNTRNIPISIVNLFSADENYPFEYGFHLYHSHCNLEKIKDIFKQLEHEESHIILETLDSAFSPINQDFFLYQWLQMIQASILYIFDVKQELFSQHLANIACYKKANIPLKVIINNNNNTKDSSWLQYIWEQVQNRMDIEVIGLLKYNQENQFHFFENEINQIIKNYA